MASMTFLSVDAFWSVASNMVLFACARSNRDCVRGGGGVLLVWGGALAARQRERGARWRAARPVARRCSFQQAAPRPKSRPQAIARRVFGRAPSHMVVMSLYSDSVDSEARGDLNMGR